MYSRFLKNNSTILAPLNILLKKGVKWVWEKVENEASLRQNTLVHYDDITVVPFL